MKTQRHLIAAAFTLFTLAAVPQAAWAVAGGSVTTQLANPPVSGDPDGTCSRCQVNDMTIGSSSTSAVLELYFEDNGGDLDADIQVRVLLDNGGTREVLVEDVELVHQETEILSIPSGSDWDWDDAQYARVQVHQAV